MLIDVNLPRILQARGMREREAHALLRALEDNDNDHMPYEDVIYSLSLALGAPYVSDGTMAMNMYDAAISKGVRLVESGRPSRQSGSSITGTTVIIDQEIPQSVAAGLVGRHLKDLIEHPLLPGEEIIVAVRSGDGETAADIAPKHVSVAVGARATLMDMTLERRNLARKRAADVRMAGACKGLTPRVAISSILSFTISTMLTGLIGQIAGLRAPGLWSFTLCGAAASLIAVVLFARSQMLQEDPGLYERVDTMRSERLADRRRAILENGEA